MAAANSSVRIQLAASNICIPRMDSANLAAGLRRHTPPSRCWRCNRRYCQLGFHELVRQLRSVRLQNLLLAKIQREAHDAGRRSAVLDRQERIAVSCSETSARLRAIPRELQECHRSQYVLLLFAYYIAFPPLDRPKDQPRAEPDSRVAVTLDLDCHHATPKVDTRILN